MLYILRLLFAHNVNVKCRSLKLSGFFGVVPPPHQSHTFSSGSSFSVVSFSSSLSMSRSILGSLLFLCKDNAKSAATQKFENNNNTEQTRKKKYASRTQTEMNNKLSRQMNKTEVNSKHFNVNWSNYISKLIQSKTPWITLNKVVIHAHTYSISLEMSSIDIYRTM